MGKRVRLAYPYDMIGGRMLPKQKLVYAENDNPVWNAPEGKQFARNYKPNIVMRYSDKAEKQTFFIKTKSSVDNTELGRLRMARFGGAQAIVNAIKKNPTLLASIYERYATVKDNFKSFDSYLAKAAAKAVKEKSATVNYTGYPVSGSVVKVHNPWVEGGTGTYITISMDVLVKFAPYLCNLSVTVDGKAFWYTAESGQQKTALTDFYPNDFGTAGAGYMTFHGEFLYYVASGQKVDDAGDFTTTALTINEPNA